MGHLDKLIPLSQVALPAQPGAQPTSFLTADVKDAPRNVPLIKMRVRNRCTRGLQVKHWLVPVGEHEISVYADEVKHVLGMVEEDQQGIKAAQLKYRKRITGEVRDLLGNFGGTTDDLMAELDANGADEDRRTALAKVLTETALSVEGIFRQDHERDVLPLDAAEVVAGTEHAEPKVVEKKRDQDALAGAMGAALAAALPALAQNVADILRHPSGGGANQGGNQPRR